MIPLARLRRLGRKGTELEVSPADDLKGLLAV
jgi:hypothetical protein